MGSAIAHCRDGLPLPMEVRPDIGASFAARVADEATFDIGEPDVIRPSVRADRDGVAAAIVLAIDQQTAHASVAHLSEGDFLRTGEGGHALLKRGVDRFTRERPRWG
jgi:hypothetical protein